MRLIVSGTGSPGFVRYAQAFKHVRAVEAQVALEIAVSRAGGLPVIKAGPQPIEDAAQPTAGAVLDGRATHG